jgi:hypothetical protein
LERALRGGAMPRWAKHVNLPRLARGLRPCRSLPHASAFGRRFISSADRLASPIDQGFSKVCLATSCLPGAWGKNGTGWVCRTRRCSNTPRTAMGVAGRTQDCRGGRACDAAWFRMAHAVLPIPILQQQAPDRPSHLSPTCPRGPPWKKMRPAHQPGGNASAAPPVAPPYDPRASPDHSTWWLVPPGTQHQHGKGADKTVHFGRWVPKPMTPPKPKP